MRLPRFVICALALSAAALLPPAVSLAGALSVSPVRVHLSADERTAAVTLFNGGGDSTLVQVEALLWEQADGDDRLTPTREVIVSPAVFTLPAGKSQLVRLSLRRDPDPNRELSYRLILQEVPSAQEVQPSGLRVALRMSLPIFVAPRVEAAPELEWNATCCEGEALVLEATNRGTRHARLTDFAVSVPDQAEPVATQQLAAYILPGQSRRWVLETTLPAGSGLAAARLALHGHTEDGPVTAEIPVSGP
ncbi:MAG TPA: fimbria/pilus periplasmic chaperone [Steroidobacteraceae bacterium]|nr:fimbria/pilus periplasmic chaperone [Steroidobacteraceae bacterium]